MCSSSYRKYRCGHKKVEGVDYCEDATYDRRTRRRSMCSERSSTTAVADRNLCGKTECFLVDLRTFGNPLEPVVSAVPVPSIRLFESTDTEAYHLQVSEQSALRRTFCADQMRAE
jgi:hypothetical protein